jgi:hypothetical protein
MSSLYFNVSYSSAFFVVSFSTLKLLTFPCLSFQMSAFSLPHIGFFDGASHSTQNLVSTAWEIYAPTNELISLHGI